MTNRIDVLDKGYIELINCIGDDDTIARVAKFTRYTPFVQDKKSTKMLIKTLMNKGHTSTFEFVEFTFKVKCPIFVARQWMRHRTWNYMEVSRRMVSTKPDYFLDVDCIAIGKLEKVYNYIDNVYLELLQQGVRPEIARTILPLGTYTEFYAKVDLNNLLKFLDKRLDNSAQKEIREYAVAILQFLKDIVPMTTDYFLERR